MTGILFFLGYVAAFVLGWFCHALFGFDGPRRNEPWDDLEI
jgi:hypothetical protein